MSILILVFLITQSNTVFARGETSVSIMTYNAENLFDATDDKKNQHDHSYLPLREKKRWKTSKCESKSGYYRHICETLDWTQKKYYAKLAKISKVLLDYDKDGADVIVLEELENKRVITDLWKRHLIWHGYRAPIHFESPSSRGIDVGMISRLPMAEDPKVYAVNLGKTSERPTRDIVVATFKVGGNKKIRVAANHWPSQANDVQTRLVAAKIVKKIANQAKHDKIPFIATGDFNTTVSEQPNPIENNLTDNRLDSSKRPLVDIQDYLGMISYFPKGTHFYKGDMSWNYLDRFLVSKDLFQKKSKVKVDLRSFEIFAPRYLFIEEDMEDPQTGKIRRYIIPQRFDFNTGEGYSDHLPVALKLRILN